MANAGTGGCGLGAHHGVDAGTGSRRSRSRSRGAKRGFGTQFVSELPEFFGVEGLLGEALGDEGYPDIDKIKELRRILYLAWYEADEAMARCLATWSRTTSVTATTAAAASASSASVENCGFSFIGDRRHSATVSETTEEKASEWLSLLNL